MQEYKLETDTRDLVDALPSPKDIKSVWYHEHKFYILMDDLIKLKNEDKKDDGQG